MFDYKTTENERNYFIQADTIASSNEDDDDDVDVAFPFELRTGHVVLRWMNYSLRKFGSSETTNGTNGDGNATRKFLQTFQDIQTKHLYMIAMRTMPNEMAKVLRDEKGRSDGKRSGGGASVKDPYTMGRLVLEAGKLCCGKKIGNFLIEEQMVPDHEAEMMEQQEQEQEKQKEKQKEQQVHSPGSKKRRKRVKSRETTDVQRVLYKGKMIDVEDPSEQLLFALLCQIMSLRPTVDEVEIEETSNKEEEHPLACLMREQERKEMEDAMDENEKKSRELSASKIQALHRGRKARGNTLVEHKERTFAATKIQAIHRGRQQRREKPRLILGYANLFIGNSLFFLFFVVVFLI